MYKDFIKYRDRYIIGALMGVIIFFILCIVYRCMFLPTESSFYLNYHHPIGVKKGAIVSDTTESLAVIQEKINAIHSRFNDLYIFGGVIVTLLLAINVSVYVRTSTEVQKHMKENFGSYRDEILQMHAEAGRVLSEIKTSADLKLFSERNNQDIQTTQKTEQNDNHGN